MNLVIFDLDGVITSEVGYWRTASEGVRELLSLPPTVEAIPENFIHWVKNHAINHNWDLAFVAKAVHESRMGFEEFQHAMRSLWGRELLEACPGYRAGPWKLCHEVCQRIQDSKAPPDEVLYDHPRLYAALREITSLGYMLAVATGRPRAEALAPLTASGVLSLFEPDRVVTHDDVVRAEMAAAEEGKRIPLGKPHPYVVWKAMHPSIPDLELATGDFTPAARDRVIFVGDTLSDVRAAVRAGVFPVGVVTALPAGSGFYQQRKQALEAAGCEKILDTLEELPAILT